MNSTVAIYTARDAASRPNGSGEHITLHTPVQYDQTLIARLLSAHEMLNARFAALLCELEREPAAVLPAIADCAAQLHELRRIESMWLYPLIARCIDSDAAARTQLMQLRLHMLTAARRLFRHFEELASAIRNDGDFRAAAAGLSAALSDYLRRNETEIYPLYDLTGMRGDTAQVRAA